METQTETSGRQPFTPPTAVKTQDAAGVRRAWKDGTLSKAGGNVRRCSVLCGKQSGSSSGTETRNHRMTPQFYSSNTRIRELKTGTQTRTHTHVFTAAPFPMAETWQLLPFLQVDGCVNKAWHIHRQRNSTQPQAAVWTDLQNSTYARRDTCHPVQCDSVYTNDPAQIHPGRQHGSGCQGRESAASGGKRPGGHSAARNTRWN